MANKSILLVESPKKPRCLDLIKYKTDPSVPDNEMWICNERGDILSRITDLAVDDPGEECHLP